MTRYILRTKRELNHQGNKLSPADDLAIVETDLNIYDLTNLMFYRHLEFIQDMPEVAKKTTDPKTTTTTPESNLGENQTIPPTTSPVTTNTVPKVQSDFAGFGDKVVASLAAEGVLNHAQGALYLSQHKTFVHLKDIGKATNERLIKQITDAGFPIE